jgi:cytoskeletal protein CcmA (bactofilin family)
VLRDLLKPNPSSPLPEAPDPAGGAGSRTILAMKTRITGSLKTEGDVTLADIFEGDITARGEVRVGRNATLDGDLSCQSAFIAGLVRGDVTAKVINITGTGRVLGSLHTERLLTEEGSFIEGTVTLDYEVKPFTSPAAASADAAPESESES